MDEEPVQIEKWISIPHAERNIRRALKLQKLLKKWLEDTKKPIEKGHVPLISLGGLQQKIQSIIEESEK